jgi:hypothetical protein
VRVRVRACWAGAASEVASAIDSAVEAVHSQICLGQRVAEPQTVWHQ